MDSIEKALSLNLSFLNLRHKLIQMFLSFLFSHFCLSICKTLLLNVLCPRTVTNFYRSCWSCVVQRVLSYIISLEDFLLVELRNGITLPLIWHRILVFVLWRITQSHILVLIKCLAHLSGPFRATTRCCARFIPTELLVCLRVNRGEFLGVNTCCSVEV